MSHGVIHNHQKVETIQRSTNTCDIHTNKLHKVEGNSDTCYDVNESRWHYSKGGKVIYKKSNIGFHG